MAKRRRDTWTPEAVRMAHLIEWLKRTRGATHATIGEALGVDESYISLLVRVLDDPAAPPRGIGAELIRLAMVEFKVNPWFFFELPSERVPRISEYLIERASPNHSPAQDFTRVRKRDKS